MIKKLRRRLVLITMSLITFVLTFIFSLQIYSTVNKMEFESVQSLNKELNHFIEIDKYAPDPDNDIDPNPIGDPESGMFKLPQSNPFDDRLTFSSFFVSLDANNIFTVIKDSGINAESEEISQAINAALEQGDNTGIISNLSLRYRIVQTSDNKHIIGFIDISYEQNFIRQQVFSYLIIGLGSLIAFFLISIILSRIAVRPVEQAWAKQQQFITDASHELKTPITVMLANTAILLSDKKQDKVQSRKWISHIDQEARHMKKLVEEMFFLARADAKDESPLMSQLDLSDVVYQNVLPFEPLFFDAGNTFDIHIEPDLKITGNAGRIKQLISILLDNAQKYAYPKSKISFSLAKENNRAVIRVNNMSDPIAKEDIDKIFDRFFRVDKARKRDTNSYGLGLSIAKEIVLMHSGKIAVTSNKTTGTTFKIMLPLN